MGLGKKVGSRLAPRVTQLAPGLTSSFVNQALNRAITGVGRFAGAAEAADAQLSEQHGDVQRAVHEVIENHVRYAGAQGFVTNLGGLITMTVTVPTNIAGLALIECRMVAGIAHLRGYDLEDPRTRTAILACLLGEEKMLSLIKKKALPGTPMAIATAAAYDPDLGRTVANEVASELVTRVAGKRIATTVGRRVPVVGGVIGAGADGFATWRIGRYVDREFLPRAQR